MQSSERNENEMTIYEKLASVQKTLKAPKGQYNDFGKYKYRSCEDILEAVKPLLAANKLAITISDDMTDVGGRCYVKSTATLFDCESGEALVVTANAREEETKKGMDGSQITGAASSYARKYALNGLFAIDDAKDSDATNGEGAAPQPTCVVCGKTVAFDFAEKSKAANDGRVYCSGTCLKKDAPNEG